MEVHAAKPGDTVGVETQGLTFQRLLVWTKEPKARMKLLAALVEACHGQRGGALASVIHSFLHVCSLFLALSCLSVSPSIRPLSSLIFSVCMPLSLPSPSFTSLSFFHRVCPLFIGFLVRSF